ncbi:hypothetical protein BT96DRAFT_1059512 [Gymnopus androsaceus JB14]|uniref:Uncharacterized protein n=1 Tax=Gymnopus androsaceus JB14 TaxID=1447944 RepID=A0A6A4H3A0_9AGAR|nr:hypothetical protein BT96DRAFT_1059512 [Gymnopus androsaceus JB14]
MPVQGSVTTTGQHEVVSPFESKVKKIIQLIDQTPEQKEKDRRFHKKDKSPLVAGEQLEVLNACLSAVTVLSFLGGPEGIVLASGIVLFQGLLNVAANSGKADALTTMKAVLQKIHDQDQTRKQLTKVRVIAHTVDTQWKEFVDDPRPSALEAKKTIDGQLTVETSPETGSLSYSISHMEDLMTWDDTEVRISILASLTYLFVVFNLQCRIYASLARIEVNKGDKMKLECYETYVTTFRIRVQQMKNELETRTTRLKQLYEEKKNGRIAAVSTEVSVEKHNAPASMENNNVTVYVKYADRYAEKEYSAEVPIGFFAHAPSSEDIQKKSEEMTAELQTFKKELTDYATRAIANDLVVVNQWAEIVNEAELLLRPPAPKVPPNVNHYQATEKSKVHKYLENARWVAYAYSVGTAEDGDSPPSPWTDWLELKTDEHEQIQLPVLILRDSNQVVETRRTVYHCKCMDVKPASTRPEATAPEKMLDEWKSEIITAKGAVLWTEP